VKNSKLFAFFIVQSNLWIQLKSFIFLLMNLDNFVGLSKQF